MRQIGWLHINKKIEGIIESKVYVTNAPYEFRIYGTHSGNMSTHESAKAAWEKIKAWSEKEYAFAELLEDNFQYKGKQSNMYLLVKITDPTAVAIERIVAERQVLKYGKEIEFEWMFK